MSDIFDRLAPDAGTAVAEPPGDIFDRIAPKQTGDIFDRIAPSPDTLTAAVQSADKIVAGYPKQAPPVLPSAPNIPPSDMLANRTDPTTGFTFRGSVPPGESSQQQVVSGPRPALPRGPLEQTAEDEVVKRFMPARPPVEAEWEARLMPGERDQIRQSRAQQERADVEQAKGELVRRRAEVKDGSFLPEEFAVLHSQAAQRFMSGQPIGSDEENLLKVGVALRQAQRDQKFGATMPAKFLPFARVASFPTLQAGMALTPEPDAIATRLGTGRMGWREAEEALNQVTAEVANRPGGFVATQVAPFAGYFLSPFARLMGSATGPLAAKALAPLGSGIVRRLAGTAVNLLPFMGVERTIETGDIREGLKAVNVTDPQVLQNLGICMLLGEGIHGAHKVVGRIKTMQADRRARDVAIDELVRKYNRPKQELIQVAEQTGRAMLDLGPTEEQMAAQESARAGAEPASVPMEPSQAAGKPPAVAQEPPKAPTPTPITPPAKEGPILPAQTQPLPLPKYGNWRYEAIRAVNEGTDPVAAAADWYRDANIMYGGDRALRNRVEDFVREWKDQNRPPTAQGQEEAVAKPTITGTEWNALTDAQRSAMAAKIASGQIKSPNIEVFHEATEMVGRVDTAPPSAEEARAARREDFPPEERAGIASPIARPRGLKSRLQKILTPKEEAPTATKQPWEDAIAPRDEAKTGEVGYFYHTTTRDALADIQRGKLNVGRPQDSEVWTDEPQTAWPDGATERRSYWSNSESATVPFSKQGAAVLRVHENAVPGKMRRESTGDHYSTRPIPARSLEYLAEGGIWKPLIARPVPSDAALAKMEGKEIKRGNIPVAETTEAGTTEQPPVAPEPLGQEPALGPAEPTGGAERAKPLVLTFASDITGKGKPPTWINKNARDVDANDPAMANAIIEAYFGKAARFAPDRKAPTHKGPLDAVDHAQLAKALDTMQAYRIKTGKMVEIDTGNPDTKLWIAPDARAGMAKKIADLKAWASGKKAMPGQRVPLKEGTWTAKRYEPTTPRPAKTEGELYADMPKLGLDKQIVVAGKRVMGTDGKRAHIIEYESPPAETGAYTVGKAGELGTRSDTWKSEGNYGPVEKKVAEFSGLTDILSKPREQWSRGTVLLEARAAGQTAQTIAALRSAAKQAEIFTSDEYKGAMVVLNEDGSFGLASGNLERGGMEINVHLGYKEVGGVQPKYLIDALDFMAKAGAETDIEISKLKGEAGAFILESWGKGRKLTALVMPVNQPFDVKSVRVIGKPEVAAAAVPVSEGGAGKPLTRFRVGDTISDGFVVGRVMGEGVLGKRKWPAYKIEVLSGHEKGKTSLILAENAFPAPVAGKGKKGVQVPGAIEETKLSGLATGERQPLRTEAGGFLALPGKKQKPVGASADWIEDAKADKIESSDPRIRVFNKRRDMGWIARVIGTLSNTSQKSGSENVKKGAELLVERPIAMNGELSAALTHERGLLKTLPKEYRRNEGAKFWELMDQYHDPATIDADPLIPDAVKPVLKQFKQIDEQVRIYGRDRARAFRTAAYSDLGVDALAAKAKEAGLNVEVRLKGEGAKIEAGEKPGQPRLYDFDSGEFVTKDVVAGRLAVVDVPDNWGRQWAHIYHAFFGDLEIKRVDAEGKEITIGSADTPAEGYKKAKAYLAGNPDASAIEIQVKPRLFFPADMLRLSRGRYFLMQKQLTDAMEATAREVQDGVRGVIGRRESKQKWYGPWQQRKGAEGFSKEFWRVWEASRVGFFRHKYLTDLNRQLQPLIEGARKEGLPRWADYLQEAMDYTWGRKPSFASQAFDDFVRRIPILKDFAKPQLLDRMLAKVRAVEFTAKLQTPKFGVLNTLQTVQTLWPVIGTPAYLRALKMPLTAEGKAILARHHVGGMSAKLHEAGMREKGWERFTPAGATEMSNQARAFLALYEHGRSLGMDDAAAARYGRLRGQVMTQFAYAPADIPWLFRGPIPSTLFQFKRFTVKNLELAVRMKREGNYGGIARWLAAQIIIGGARQFLNIGSKAALGTVLYVFLKKHIGEKPAEIVAYGLPAVIGVDMSGSASPFNPPTGETLGEQLLSLSGGPLVGDAQRIARAWDAKKLVEPSTAVARTGKAIVESAPAVRQLFDLFDALNSDTTNLDARGRQRYRVEVADKWRRAFGFRPVRETQQADTLERLMDIEDDRDAKIDELATLEMGGKDTARPLDVWNSAWPEFEIADKDITRRVAAREKERGVDALARQRSMLPKAMREKAGQMGEDIGLEPSEEPSPSVRRTGPPNPALRGRPKNPFARSP